jgi:hypothetical protein
MGAVRTAEAEKWKLVAMRIQRTEVKEAEQVTDPRNGTTIVLNLEKNGEEKVIETKGSDQLYLLLNKCMGRAIEERSSTQSAPQPLFLDTASSRFISEYAMEGPIMLSHENTYRILLVEASSRNATDGEVYKGVKALLSYGESTEKNVVLHILLDSSAKYKPYVDRIFNFLQASMYFNIKPKADISSVIINPKNTFLDLDKFFLTMSPKEPRMKAGEIYLLNDVSDEGHEVVLSYSRVRSAFGTKRQRYLSNDEDYSIYHISGYSNAQAFPGRSVGEIFAFFNEKIGQYFTVGENIYNNMLDYMMVDSSKTYPVFRFEYAHEGSAIDAYRKIRALKRAVRPSSSDEDGELGSASGAWTDTEKTSFS